MKILYYPQQPAGGQRVFHYLKNLGIEWTGDIHDDGITHIHHYNHSNRRDYPSELLSVVPDGASIINYTLLNIKKDYIDDVFTDVFGYSIRLDPTEHRGMCFKRSSQNAIHAGQFVQCPIQPYEIDTVPRISNSGEPHYRMYVKIIDTRISATRIRDFRVVVMGYKPVYLFEKHIDSTCIFHSTKDKYFHTYGHTTLDKFFSLDEQNKIKAFLWRAGVDFAEIDILRDNSTGLMYICDVNDVPGGGVFNSMDNGQEAIEYLANQYKTVYELC